MDYEKRYKKALERAKDYHKQLLDEDNPECAGEIENIFPELAENKDEKIRKVIRGWIYTRPDSFFDNGVSKEEILAWLEKQAPKPKWSDEDEQYLLICKNALRKYQVSDKWDADIISKWLEDNLKQRNGWKPSEEQIDAIRYVVQHYTPNACEELAWDSLKTLEIMCNDLNKLKGE